VDGAVHGFEFARKDAEQGRFARAVRADESDLVATRNAEIDFRKDGADERIELDGKTMGLEQKENLRRF